MKIGIDIDGVLTDESSFIKDYGSKFCYENNIETSINLSLYDCSDTLGISESQYNRFWNKYLEFYSLNAPARPFASEVIKELSKNNNIYIITSRNHSYEDSKQGEKMRDIVKNWLFINNIIFDDIYFVKEKSKICKELGIDFMIDDKPENIIDLSKFTNVICYNDFCNENISGPHIFRCYSWYDILHTIKEN